ncbi:hypothetical protein Micbo1qcDRAFT_127787 [Microdochium bolleyi]|uniref:Tyrosinase copper-binding domain-containing protein n=1 Tax=Microdochium bolleyi TaxID=196109 RepID=A0A136IKR7_9PEZI|nr:hypothetical protein Micbo1qcDRAFT_127787 [Microdochium bolleyi]
MEKLRAKEKLHPPGPGKCSLRNARKRKDWEKMSIRERRNYLDAVQCMFTKPSTVSKDWAAGARVRYDDFAAIHINKTLGIHGTGNFLTWHRYHNWLYEKALREDCGYRGAQPYWNWFKYQDRLMENPLFDGSNLSMGGQGEYFEHNGTLAAGVVYVPSGTGGGCVQGGFIQDVKISLGPIRPAMRGMSDPVKDTNVYNPRCLRRDLNQYAAVKWHTYENLLDIVTGPHSGDIVTFQDEFQGRPPDGFLGLHSGGHHVIGGDNSDNYSSVVDPLFHFHHAMVDYVYWLWQALHPELADQVGGTVKARSPELGYTKRTDVLDLGEVAPNLKIEETLDTLAGPYCYIYE